MCYSIIDRDLDPTKPYDNVQNLISCGLNSRSIKDVKKSILRCIKMDMKTLNDYRVWKNSKLEDILKLLHIDVFAHKYPLSECTYLVNLREKL